MRRAEPGEPVPGRTRRRGHPRQTASAGRLRLGLSGRRPCRGPPQRRCRLRPGRAFQPGGPGSPGPTPRRRSPAGLRRTSPGPYPPGGATGAHPRAGRHSHLVLVGAQTGVASGPRRSPLRVHLYPLGRASPGRLQLPADAHLVSHRHGLEQAQGGGRLRHRPRCRAQKKLIEDAYTLGERLGLAVWCGDEAGPFQTIPHPGPRWQPEGQPAQQPHEYIRNGTAKVLTLFHPADGRVRVEGVSNCPNEVLHPWLQRELSEILAGLPEPPPTAQAPREAWQRWQQGLSVKPSLPAELPPLRMLLVLDNLTGHKTPELLRWLFAHGIMPLYTPLSGSWLNMAESIQRILKRRALAGQHPGTPEQIKAWFAAVAAP